MKLPKLSLGQFTVIELLLCLLIILALGLVILTSIRSVRAQNRDRLRKTELNSIAYQLESFYEKNGHYPQTISLELLPGLTAGSLTDENGKAIGEAGSRYTYVVRGCSEVKCSGYVLRTDLEKEAPFIKTSHAL